jgi:uncharacterized membrane protein YgdD (TMEM256/DUF423 family)
MTTAARMIAFAGALLCLSAVILGALGSHLVDMKGMQGIWKTASNMHLFNAAGLMGVAALLSNFGSGVLKWGAWTIITGTLIFSGSIYLHVITGMMITNMAPVGGMLMMTGWGLVALAFLRTP